MKNTHNTLKTNVFQVSAFHNKSYATIYTVIFLVCVFYKAFIYAVIKYIKLIIKKSSFYFLSASCLQKEAK